MNKYDLYQRAWQRREEQILEQVAVKRGFSWPAFLFGMLWAYSKKMWRLAAILAVIVIPINVLGFFALYTPGDLPQWATDLLGGSVGLRVFGVVANLTSLGIAIYVGFNGNDWQCRSLEARGFDSSGTIEGDSAKSALALHGNPAAQKSYSLGGLLVGGFFLPFALLFGFVSIAARDPMYLAAFWIYLVVSVVFLIRCHFPPLGFWRGVSTFFGAMLVMASIWGPFIEAGSNAPLGGWVYILIMSVFIFAVGTLFILLGLWGVWGFGVKSDRTRFIKHVIGRKLGYSMSAMMVLVLVVALGYFASSKQVAQPVKAETAEKSIAVLPFVNMSNDASNEVFSDGISVDILISLAKVEELQVAGWASASAFKDQSKSIQEIAAALDVDYIMEGSVRRVGDRVRITAQVIDSDDFHVWSETYDRTLDDVPAIQDEIVAAVVAQLNKGHATD